MARYLSPEELDKIDRQLEGEPPLWLTMLVAAIFCAALYAFVVWRG